MQCEHIFIQGGVNMERSLIKVGGMSCEHCVKAVTRAVGALPGIGGVDVDLKAGAVTVEHDPQLTALDEIKRAIEEEGYEIIG